MKVSVRISKIRDCVKMSLGHASAQNGVPSAGLSGYEVWPQRNHQVMCHDDLEPAFDVCAVTRQLPFSMQDVDDPEPFAIRTIPAKELRNDMPLNGCHLCRRCSQLP